MDLSKDILKRCRVLQLNRSIPVSELLYLDSKQDIILCNLISVIIDCIPISLTHFIFFANLFVVKLILELNYIFLLLELIFKVQ